MFGAMILALVASIAYRLFTGGISTSGLFATRRDGGTDPERVQSLVIALGAVGYYAFVGIGAVFSPTDSAHLPDLPPWVLTALGGSQLLYLIGKQLRRVSPRR